MKTYKARRRLLFFGTISIIILISIATSVSLRIAEIHKIKMEKLALEENLATLAIDEEKVKNELEKLQDPDYVARYAREKYLYSKDDEFIIRIP